MELQSVLGWMEARLHRCDGSAGWPQSLMENSEGTNKNGSAEPPESNGVRRAAAEQLLGPGGGPDV